MDKLDGIKERNGKREADESVGPPSINFKTFFTRVVRRRFLMQNSKLFYIGQLMKAHTFTFFS